MNCSHLRMRVELPSDITWSSYPIGRFPVHTNSVWIAFSPPKEVAFIFLAYFGFFVSYCNEEFGKYIQ